MLIHEILSKFTAEDKHRCISSVMGCNMPEKSLISPILSYSLFRIECSSEHETALKALSYEIKRATLIAAVMVATVRIAAAAQIILSYSPGGANVHPIQYLDFFHTHQKESLIGDGDAHINTHTDHVTSRRLAIGRI